MDMEPEPTTPPHMIGFAAGWAAVITALCVLIGQGAAQFVGPSQPAGSAPLASEGEAKTARPNFNTIDFATTGAVKGQTIVISPCTGKPVGP